MPVPSDLRYFRVAEFGHPELVDEESVRYLDEVRHRYGRPLVVTDDARLPGECPPGCSPTSWHPKGRAFDLRWSFPDKYALFDFVRAAIDAASGRPIEVELVRGPTDRHAHLALKEPGHRSSFVLALD